MPDIGQSNQTLITGRTAYGFDGTNAYPLKVAGSANLGILETDTRNTETIQTELLAATSIAASTETISTVLSVVGVKQALIFIDHGRASTAAFGGNGTEYAVQVSQKASGDETWRTIASVLASSVAAASALSATSVLAGTSVVGITSGTNFAVGDIIVVANTTTPANIEWCTVKAISGTANFTIRDALTYDIAAGTAQTMYTKAEHFTLNLDVAAATRIRVVANNIASGTTNAVYSRIACITEK